MTPPEPWFRTLLPLPTINMPADSLTEAIDLLRKIHPGCYIDERACYDSAFDEFVPNFPHCYIVTVWPRPDDPRAARKLLSGSRCLTSSWRAPYRIPSTTIRQCKPARSSPANQKEGSVMADPVTEAQARATHDRLIATKAVARQREAGANYVRAKRARETAELGEKQAAAEMSNRNALAAEAEINARRSESVAKTLAAEVAARQGGTVGALGRRIAADPSHREGAMKYAEAVAAEAKAEADRRRAIEKSVA